VQAHTCSENVGGGERSAVSHVYESSQVFDRMKTIRERIPGNMTSFQYLSVYYELLSRAVRPIVEGSTFADSFVASMVGWQEFNFRRKISFSNRRSAIRSSLEFLVAHPDRKWKKFKAIRLERGVLAEMVEAFLLSSREAQAAASGSLERLVGESVHSYEARCRMVHQDFCHSINCDMLVRIRREAEFWLKQAIEFREKVLEKYYRLCIQTAQRDYASHFHMSVPLDDIINSYVMAAARAIDKCDYTQGVLTSHIKNWFLTARENVGRSRGSGSVQLSEALSIDELDEDEESSQTGELSERVKEIRIIAKLVDPLGAARVFLRIKEPDEI